MKNNSKFLLLLSMFIFGTIGIFRKYIPLPSSLLAMSRGFIGTLFLLVVIFIKKEKMCWKSIKSNLLLLVLSGAFIGFNWIFLFEAYRYTTVATATLCYYMAPIFVILVSPLFFKEKLTLKKSICVAVAITGMVFVSGILQSGFNATKEMKGVVLGLMAALLYAGVVVMNKHIKSVSAFDKTIVQLGTSAVVLLPYTMLTENLAEITFTPTLIIMLCIVGIVHTGIAYTLYFGVMDKLKAQTVALFSYVDPVVAILLSAVILHENIGVWGYIGAVLVLGATLVSELPEKNK